MTYVSTTGAVQGPFLYNPSVMSFVSEPTEGLWAGCNKSPRVHPLTVQPYRAVPKADDKGSPKQQNLGRVGHFRESFRALVASSRSSPVGLYSKG